MPDRSEENIGLVNRYFSQCVSGATGPDPRQALAILDDLLTDDFVMAYNSETDAEAVHGRERHKDFVAGHARAFPEDQWTIEAIVADATSVACQWRFRATHADTGKTVDVRAADFFSVRDGRLATMRRFLDFASFRKQFRSGRSAH